MRIKIIPLILIVLIAPILTQPALAEQQFNFTITFELPTDSARSFVFGNYLKEALKPLGIDVILKFVPWKNLVSDLLRTSSSDNDWDLIEIGFANGPEYADYGRLYHSEGYWGGIVYQLGDPNFQDHQLVETGLNQTQDIDTLIDSHDFEYNLTKRYELQNEFIDLYMTKLLWDIPTVIPLSATSMATGYGGPNNELWDVKEGVIESRALGAKWDPANIPALRTSDTSTLRLATGVQDKFNLDPFQGIDTSQSTQTDWTHQGELLVFDKDLNPHPNTAWNFFSGDYGDTVDDDNNPATPELPVTQYTFILRDDVFWHDTLDFEGNMVPGERVDGLDYNLTLTMYDMATQSSTFTVNGINDWDNIADWDISTTVFPHDTITIRIPNIYRSPIDLLNFGSLQPLPAHLLGGDLTYYNPLTGLDETSPLVPGMPISPWDTYEWNSFESFAGNTAVGPYKMVDFEFNVFYSFASRSDYWYPNEWDVEVFHTLNAADVDILTIESSYGLDLSLFGGSIGYSQDAYYWTYDEIAGNHAKPTSQNIDNIEYVVIGDPGAIYDKFLAGDVDVLVKSKYPVSDQIMIENNQDFVSKKMKGNVTPRIFIFDLLHPHLRKINVRKAIAHAIDTQVFIDFYRGNAVKANSSNYGQQKTYEGAGIPYDLDVARNYMLMEGYSVPTEYLLPNIQIDNSIDFDNSINFNLDNNQFDLFDNNSVFDPTGIEEEKSTTINYLSFFFGIVLIAIIYYKKK